jgi:hypothetical protein
MSCLQPEELTVEIAAFLLAGINLSGKIFSLGFPFRDNLGENIKGRFLKCSFVMKQGIRMQLELSIKIKIDIKKIFKLDNFISQP